MNRRIRSSVLTLGAVLIVAGSFTAGVFAQGGPARPGRPGPGAGVRGFAGPGPGGLPLGQLDLSESQRTQIRDITVRYRQEIQAVGERLRSAMDAQRKAVETVPVNEGLVRSTAEALTTAQTDMALVQARIYNDVYSVLTPEQQAKATSLEAQREARLKQREQRLQQQRQRPRPRPQA